jgi:hypothetical protein
VETPDLSPWLLRLIADNEEIQELIVSWPNVHAELVVGQGLKVSRDNAALVEGWARRCGLRPEEVRQMWDKMFSNGFVTEDGKANAVACKFIASLMLKDKRTGGGR